jgi:hypothetical protein
LIFGSNDEIINVHGDEDCRCAFTIVGIVEIVGIAGIAVGSVSI